MTIAITGISGFIGRFLTRTLISKGYVLNGIDCVPYPEAGVGRFIQGDFVEKEASRKLLPGCEAVIHLAAAHHDFGVSRQEFFRVNREGTRNILECASETGIKKFIFYSSVAVYGDSSEPTTEDTVPNPSNDYGESKLAAEQEVIQWAESDPRREVVIIRPGVVFGPENYANMYNLIDKIYRRQFLFIGKGGNIKSVAYVENLVAATVFLMNRMKPGVEIYNYTDYPQMTTKEIVGLILGHLGRKEPRVKLPLGPTLFFASVFDILAKITGYNFPITARRIKKFNTPTHHQAEKIRREGFKAPVSLDEGFQRMIQWYVKKGTS